MLQPSLALVSWGTTPQRQTTIRIAGFLFERTWVHVLFFSVIPFESTQDHLALLYSNMTLSILFLATTLIVTFFAFPHVARLLLSKYFVALAAVLCASGTMALPFLESESAAGALLGFASAIATGVGSALLFLGWLRIIGDLGSRQSLREYALALAASYALAIALSVMPGPVAVTASCLFPFCSAWLLRVSSYFRGEVRPGYERSESTATLCSKLATAGNLRRVTGAFAIGFVAGLVGIAGSAVHQTELGMGNALFFGGLAITSIAALTLWLRPHWALRTIHRIAPFALAVGCALLGTSSPGGDLANPLAHAGFACYALSILAISVFLARALRVDPLRIVCLNFASMYFGELAGLATGQFMGFPLERAALAEPLGIVLMTIVLASGLFLCSESDLLDIAYRPETTNNAELNASASEPGTGEHSGKSLRDVKDVCAYLSETCGLTPRETDILPLLLKGRTIARIQEELFISASTVNTHVRHIYQKCNVPNKQALIDLAEKIQARKN